MIPLTDHSWPLLLAAGILAGWLMSLFYWLVAATRESIARHEPVAVDE